MAQDRPIRCPTKSLSAVSWRKLTDHKQIKSNWEAGRGWAPNQTHTALQCPRAHMPDACWRWSHGWCGAAWARQDGTSSWCPTLGCICFQRHFPRRLRAQPMWGAQAPHTQGIPLSHRELQSLGIKSNEGTKEEVLFSFCASPHSLLSPSKMMILKSSCCPFVSVNKQYSYPSIAAQQMHWETEVKDTHGTLLISHCLTFRNTPSNIVFLVTKTAFGTSFICIKEQTALAWFHRSDPHPVQMAPDVGQWEETILQLPPDSDPVLRTWTQGTAGNAREERNCRPLGGRNRRAGAVRQNWGSSGNEQLLPLLHQTLKPCFKENQARQAPIQSPSVAGAAGTPLCRTVLACQLPAFCSSKWHAHHSVQHGIQHRSNERPGQHHPGPA